MQRALISAAVLAACTIPAAHAQSSVTLYGIVDVGVFSTRTEVAGVSNRTTGMVSGGQSGSRWGLRGSEDLGGGLKANFRLESGINANNGTSGQNSRAFGRAAWVGLSGGFGEVRFGRQATVASDYFARVSPFGSSWSNAAIGKSGFRASDTPRFDNSITYYSPNFSGFSVAAGYTFNSRGNADISDNNVQAFSLAGRYSSGPIYVALTYDRLDPAEVDTNANGRNPSAIQLGGSYDFKVVQVFAGWSQQKDGWIKSAEGSTSAGPDLGGSAYFDGKVNSYLLGVKVPFGASTLLGSVHYVDPDNKAFPGGDEVMVYNLGYSYKLSKRTDVYAMFSYRDGDLYNFRKDSETQQFGIGLRHSF